MPPISQPSREPDHIRWRRRLLALGLVAAGSAFLAGNLGVLPAGLTLAGRWAAPFLAIGLGVWLVARAPQTAAAVRGFAIDRAEHQGATLVVAAGVSDVEVREAPDESCLAAGEFPGARGPGLSVRGSQARLELSGRQAGPLAFARRWSAALAADLPWNLDARSWTGDLDLDLRGLMVTSVRLRTTFGDARVELPAAGQVDVDARAWAGDVRLCAPEGMAVRVKVRSGPLAAVRVDGRRYVQLAPGEWASPLFAVSANRCTVNVDVWAGDLDLE